MSPEARQFYLKLSVVLVFVSIFFYVVFYFYNYSKELRDVKRTADINRVIAALQLYNQEHDHYPKPTKADSNDWDTTKDNEFLYELVDSKYLLATPFDPVNNDEYYYRYRYFSAKESGCDRPMAVLQVINFEEKNYQVSRLLCQSEIVGDMPANGFTWSGND